MRASLPAVPVLVTILVLSLPLLSACGLKDDLYLPPPEPAVAPAGSEPAEDEEEANAARP